ncbi:MAG TPA: hypothetical protein EYP90_02955 [Chromatiaceae bacterium]|nr:hypothetical protein [Chromatiaceae bacterium]HIP71680.1 hypothetical protein [Anaerolineae bacterium]
MYPTKRCYTLFQATSENCREYGIVQAILAAGNFQEFRKNFQEEQQMNRPIAVTILAILAVIAGIIAILDTLRYLNILPIASLGPLNFFGFSFIGAIMAGIVALIWFWDAKMLWTLDPRGWTFTIFHRRYLSHLRCDRHCWPLNLASHAAFNYCIGTGYHFVRAARHQSSFWSIIKE